MSNRCVHKTQAFYSNFDYSPMAHQENQYPGIEFEIGQPRIEKQDHLFDKIRAGESYLTPISLPC